MPLAPRSHPAACLLAHFIALATAQAQTTWDGGGGGAETTINNPANWNSPGNDILPSFTGTTAVTFGTGGSTATINAHVSFTGVTLNRAAAFTLAPDALTGGSLTLRSVNSGSTPNLIVSTAAGGVQTIDAPLHVDTTNTANRFLAIANNSASQTLDINGALARGTSATADFALRFYGVAGSTTRIDGPVSNLAGVQQIFNTNSGTTWGGDLVFGGDRASTASISIASNGTGNAPASTARLFLGESPADVQSWGNITLNNTIQLIVGGTISAGTISVGGSASASGTRILGHSTEHSSLSLTGGSFTTNVTLGGPGVNDNHFGLIKTGPATLTLGGAHTYAGSTVVQTGGLALTGQIVSPVVIQAGGTLSGEGSTSGTLTFGAGLSTLQFNPATEPGALTAASVSAPGATVIVSPSAAISPGATYTVLRLSAGVFSGAPSAVFAPGARGATLAYANADTELAYTAGSASAADLVWSGDHATNPTFWDVVATPNWTNAGAPDRFYAGDNVLFDDTATTTTVAIQGSSVPVGNLVFDHTTKNYVVSGGVLAGSGSLTKRGGGALTLAQTSVNTFSGPLALQGGTLSVSLLNQIGGASSTRAIGFDGGTLAFTGPTATTNTIPVTLGALGGTISITGSTLNSDGSTAYSTLRLGAPITGAGDLIKTGPAVLALGQNTAVTLGNTFSGAIHVNQGVLDIRNPDSLGLTSAGTFIDNANLTLFPFGQNAGVTFAAEPLTFLGSSHLRHQNDDLDSDIVNTLVGPVTLSAGATLGV
ncbi:MAG: autotransporter-associated beta strand repeat-containing protein, partial [Burkholderiales bacterium]|nr:autotransporter-associated beta strand repeat-containing protein [Opitutaceae bacterium]